MTLYEGDNETIKSKKTIDDIFITNRSYNSVKKDESEFIKNRELLSIGDEHYHYETSCNDYVSAIRGLKFSLLENGYVGLSDLSHLLQSNTEKSLGGYLITGVAVKVKKQELEHIPNNSFDYEDSK